MGENPELYQSIMKFLNNNLIGFINSVDKQITNNLYEAHIETRPAKSNGIWCCVLIPAVLYGYDLVYYDVSNVYSLVTYVSLGLLFYSLLFLIFITVSYLVLKESIYGGCVASSLISALLLYTFLGQDLTFSLVFSLPTIYIYSLLLRSSLTKFPKTFTIGEAIIVSQAIVLYAVMAVGRVFINEKDSESDFIMAIINTVLLTVGLIVATLCLVPENHKNLENFGYLMGGASVFAFIVLHLVLSVHCIPRIIHYIFFHQIRVKLVAFWLFLVGIAICVIMLRTKLAVKASTVTRKTFHVLASLVFLSGIIFDLNLITLASGIGLGAMILVEALRKSGIEPISSTLQAAFLVYSDEKDCGAFAMTPLYLYCGLAGGLAAPAGAPRLDRLAGVLAIGVGDTAASWFGSKYGFNKWADSKKSVEGTTFNILSQLMTIYALQMFELITDKNAMLRTAIVAVTSALVEAKTEQVDNLVLPLVSVLSFQFTYFLA